MNLTKDPKNQKNRDQIEKNNIWQIGIEGWNWKHIYIYIYSTKDSKLKKIEFERI
jgi:hypothetical protein